MRTMAGLSYVEHFLHASLNIFNLDYPWKALFGAAATEPFSAKGQGTNAMHKSEVRMLYPHTYLLLKSTKVVIHNTTEWL